MISSDLKVTSGREHDRSPHLEATRADSSVRATSLKLPENTVQGCRDRAAADLLAAVTMVTANQRLRLEQSAHTWTMRADMLGRIEKSFEKRSALERLRKETRRDDHRDEGGQG